MPNIFNIPAGIEVRQYNNSHQVWRGKELLYSNKNALEARRWASEHAETYKDWCKWLNRDTHEWNGVQQL